MVTSFNGKVNLFLSVHNFLLELGGAEFPLKISLLMKSLATGLRKINSIATESDPVWKISGESSLELRTRSWV